MDMIADVTGAIFFAIFYHWYPSIIDWIGLSTPMGPNWWHL